MQKFETLRQPLLEPEEEEERERKMPFIVATYVYASSQGQRTHSARTKMKEFEQPVELKSERQHRIRNSAAD
jgi:hypothetical protein